MIDESANCGCRRIQLDGRAMEQVVWCPEHANGCPGPWRATTQQDYPDDGDDCDFDDDPWMRDEEDRWEEALSECGKVPAAQGGCLLAGTEYCDFDCPFRDDDDDVEEPANT